MISNVSMEGRSSNLVSISSFPKNNAELFITDNFCFLGMDDPDTGIVGVGFDS